MRLFQIAVVSTVLYYVVPLFMNFIHTMNHVAAVLN